MKRVLLILSLLAIPCSAFAQSDDDWRDRPAERERDRDRERERRRRDRDRRDVSHAPRRNAVELTPMIGYRWGGTLYAENSDLFRFDVEAASSPSYGVILGVPVGHDGIKLELMANRQSTHLQPGERLFEPDDRLADIDVHYYQAGLQIPLGYRPYAQPYLVVSAGVARLEPEIARVAGETRFAGSLGGGIKVPITRNLGFRFEARGYLTATDNEEECSRCRDDESRTFNQGEANLGLVFSF